MDGEDYFYLKKFESMEGIITERTTSTSGTHSYRVDFPNETFGYFYENDFDELA